MSRSARSCLGCATLATLILTGTPLVVRAGGFAVTDQGAQGMGFGGAFAARASDASAVFHNAAGLAFLKEREVYLGGSAILQTGSFKGADPFPGVGNTEDQRATLRLPFAVYYAHPITEKISAGLGVHSPFGFRSEWSNPEVYSGRRVAQSAKMSSVSINPAVAYKVGERLAVGGGVEMRFSSLTHERRIAGADPFTNQILDVGLLTTNTDTATGFGFNLGILARPREELALGAAYRHGGTLDYTGTALFAQLPTDTAEVDEFLRAQKKLPPASMDVTSSLTLPATLAGGASYQWNDWVFAAEVQWTRWKRDVTDDTLDPDFREWKLDFKDPSIVDLVLANGYANTLTYRAGVERRINEWWTLRGGAFLDPSPAPAQVASPAFSDADRRGVVAGATFHRGALRVHAAGAIAFFKEVSTEGTNWEGYDGTYSSFTTTLGVSVGYVF